MTWLPPAVVELLEAALVTELSVVRPDGRPMTYPLIPLWDGRRVLMTSSVLFSRKLEHIKSSPRVSLALSDPIALGGRTDRRHDPGPRPCRGRRPPYRMGTGPPALAGEGAGDPRLPEGTRGVPPLLRARRHRGGADTCLLLARRGHPHGAPGHGRARARTRRRPEMVDVRSEHAAALARRRACRSSRPSRSRSSRGSTPTACR